uniref:cryptochrome/photolyase family protein n=1 Tax=Flavobacterium sp. TaxID=239 RepID=UPI004049902F
MQEVINIFWFRRDLRWHDNAVLWAALEANEPVLPIFIFDEDILSKLKNDDARVTFIHEQLELMQAHLKPFGKSLAVFHGNPLAVFESLVKENKVACVYANHDYEPYARKRDLAVFKYLQSQEIGFKTCKDQVIFEKSEVVKDDGKPYVVYTPFMRKWKAAFTQTHLTPFLSETRLEQLAHHNYPFLSLENIGFQKSDMSMLQYRLSESIVNEYEDKRNFPALAATSLTGVYLRFGVLSVREVITKAIASKVETFWNELIWREFFMQILWHFPHTINKSFKEKYDRIEWKNDPTDFEKWCNGQTGYPFVDAGMRELNATGFMHNRVRMIVASFLCKHLLIDWRWGEAYFAEKLFDFELASNVGNWQWAAGSGVDAAPYFRIFNPTEQIKKFDKEQRYIQKWIPEVNTSRYPEPIVDHKEARERCLKTYKEAVG